jgi:integrase
MPIYKTNEKNKDGLTKYKVRHNYTDAQGKAHSLTRVAYGMQAAKELEWELAHSVQEPLDTKIATVDDLYQFWQQVGEAELKPSSYRNRETYYNNYIKEYLSTYRVDRLNAQVLTKWKNEINKRDCSLTTKKRAFSYLRGLLNFAVRQELIESNPISRIGNFKDPQYVKPEMEYYTPEEWAIYRSTALQIAQERNYFDYYVFFCIAYYTGLRKGEIQALRWNRIAGNKLLVRTSIYQKNKGDDNEGTPKNQSSIRDVLMPNNLIRILDEHRRRQSAYHGWNEGKFICGFDRSLRDTSIDKANRAIAERAGLKHIRIHDFRHSHASVLINAGINPLDVAHRLGHSTVEQTLKTYAHLFPTEAEKALAVLEKI